MEITIGLGLATAGALLFLNPIAIDPFVLPKMVLIASGVLLALIGVCARGLQANRIKNDPIIFAGCIFLYVTFYSTIFSIDKAMSILGPYLATTMAVIPICLIFMVYFLARSTNINLENIPKLILLTSIPMGFYAFCQVIGWDFLPLELLRGRAHSTIGGPVTYGLILSILLPMTLCGIFKDKMLSIICQVFIAIGLITCASRGAYLSAFIACLSIWLIKKYTIQCWKIIPVILLSVTLLPFLQGISYFGGNINNTTSDTQRIETWKIATKTFFKNPVLGTGPATMSLAARQNMTDGFIRAGRSHAYTQDTAHNDFMQIAATMGMAGILAYLFGLLAIAWVFYEAFQDGKTTPINLAAFGAFVAIFTYSKFNPVPLIGFCVFFFLLAIRNEDTKTEELSRPKYLLAMLPITTIIFGICLTMQKADMFQHYGMMAYIQKDYQTAINYGLRAAETNPYEIRYIANNQRMLHWLIPGQKPQDAIKTANIAISQAERFAKLKPNDPAVYEILCQAYLVKNSLNQQYELQDKAIQALDKALSLAPTHLPYFKRRILLAQITNDMRYFHILFGKIVRYADLEKGKA